MRSVKTFAQVLGLLVVLVIFFTSIELIGESFKLIGRGFAERLIETTANPFVGLFIGILATSLVQSSSTTTTITVGLVAGGGLTISGAIPIIMGANIGTSVTNTIVSLGSISRKEEFRRAMAGATVHDFFNLLAVGVLFPLELIFKVVSGPAAWLTDTVGGVEAGRFLSPVAVIVEPIAELVVTMVGANGIAVLVIGLLLLFLALRYLVIFLKALVLGRSEQLFHKYIFGSTMVSLLCGVVLTVLVQSSSITTSLMVPLVAAGIVSVAQIFPFVLGANLGTTITALIAALAFAATATGVEVIGATAGLKVALAHLVFNLYGTLIFLPFAPMRQVPIRLSRWLGDLTVKNRGYALAYILTVFFVIPLVTILATRNLDFDYDPPIPDTIEEQLPSTNGDTTLVPGYEGAVAPADTAEVMTPQ